MKLEEKIKQLETLNELWGEVKGLMQRHNTMMETLHQAIKKEGIDIGGGYTALPDCYDSLCDELKALTKRIDKKISLTISSCILYNIKVPAFVFSAKETLNKIKCYFEKVSDTPPFAPH